MATKKRYIDADEYYEFLRDEPEITGACFRRAVDKLHSIDAVEVVHSRFVNVADFGDDQGCFGYCERCGTIHHAQSPVALKADHRWCRWCGAKMDGDGNG